MPSNYKYYTRSAEGIQLIQRECNRSGLRMLTRELYGKLMEAEAVLKELQASRRGRWLSKADPPHSTINPPSFETQPKLNPEGLNKLKQERIQTNG